MAEAGTCKLCGKSDTLEHVIAGYGASVEKYTWRYNEVLTVLT